MTVTLQAPHAQVTVPVELLTGATVVLVSALAAVVIVTVGYSLRAARTRRRRTVVRSELRSELLDRLYGRDDPAWGAWAESLSSREREELESILGVYLREIDGRDARRLAGLGTALGIDDRSRGGHRDRRLLGPAPRAHMARAVARRPGSRATRNPLSWNAP